MNRRISGQGKKSDISKRRLKGVACFFLLIFLFIFHHAKITAHAEENPLDKMRDETLAYFTPITGKVIQLIDKQVEITVGANDAVKKGMRFNILREEAPFKHPVTKEPLGNAELLIGKIEIKEVKAESAIGEILEGSPQEGDKARISEMEVNMLFYQSQDIDWHLADSYYRKLKETGRVHLVDTSIETDNTSEIIEEAKRLRAEVALILTSSPGPGNQLNQRLFWVSDGSMISEITTEIAADLAKDLKFGEQFIPSIGKDAWLKHELPFEAKLITVADIDGDGIQEIVVGSDDDVKFYTLGAILQPALGGIKIEGISQDNFLWLDAIDLNRNGKDEILITSMRGETIISSIYELKGQEFDQLYSGDLFIRKLGDTLIEQSFSRAEGFHGGVSSMFWENGYKKGDLLKLPDNVNIYDFILFNDIQAEKLSIAYDKDGKLNLYDSQGVKIWTSKTDTGGFLKTFDKYSPTIMTDRGEWSVKDRLFIRNKDIIFVKRYPLIVKMKGLGYKKAQIKNMWWNGVDMQEGILIDDISGTLSDYVVAGDKILVLRSPLFGIKPGNILKGENPLKTELLIYTLKGI